MDARLQKKKAAIDFSINLALEIIEGLKDDDIRRTLNNICKLESLPDLSGDDEVKDFKEYQAMRGVLKKLYIETARTIIDILGSEGGFSCDEANSYNYTEPLEAMLAAEYIKMLPKAFIGGPMKAAMNHPHGSVRRIVIEYFDSLPKELQYSDIFPANFRKSVKMMKAQLSD